jgi:hypothetical protein
MAEVNAWAPDGESICVSGTPLQGQQQAHDDVFVCDLHGHDIVRLTRSSGTGGEPSRYCEHLVFGPSGGTFAYMGTAFPDPRGCDVEHAMSTESRTAQLLVLILAAAIVVLGY